MKQADQLGIWMNFTSAHLIVYSAHPVATRTLAHDVSRRDMLALRQRIQGFVHHKHEYHKTEYYGKLMDTIKNYKEVVLFGPHDSIIELATLMETDSRFHSIRTRHVKTSLLTDSQQHEFVFKYYTEPQKIKRLVSELLNSAMN